MNTLEQQAAQTILQQPEEIRIGEKTYTIAPPSIATLILVSGAISRLPHLHLDDAKVLEETLNIAKDCAGIGEIAAILILGAKHIEDTEEIEQSEDMTHLWGLFKTTRKVKKKRKVKERIAKEILEDITPRELHNLIAQILKMMQVGDFFGLTTFLTEVNLLHQTRKVEPEATASGQ